MQDCINNYFQDCDDKGLPYSITQLALSLGTTRKTLSDYEGRDKYSNVIKEAKQRIEAYVERTLLSGKAQAGCIFWLKNHGWSDTTRVELDDVSKLTKEQLAQKINTLAKVVPMLTTTESVKKQASN